MPDELDLIMFHFSKLTRTTLAAMCRLAEAYGTHRMSACVIADACRLPRPIVAKMLTDLARAGLVSGTRGPGGGFQLTRPPDQITLGEIVALHDNPQFFSEGECPLKVKCCRLPCLCPLRKQYAYFQMQFQHLLEDCNLLTLTYRAGSHR